MVIQLHTPAHVFAFLDELGTNLHCQGHCAFSSCQRVHFHAFPVADFGMAETLRVCGVLCLVATSIMANSCILGLGLVAQGDLGGLVARQWLVP